MKLFTLLPAISIIVFFLSCGNNPQNSWQGENKTELFEEEKTPEQLRAELKSKEEENPLEYVKCGRVTMHPQETQTRRAGLFHEAEYEPDGALFEGKISNSATLARFKDAKIKISFYSQTNTLIEEQSYIIYKYLEPSTSVNFSIRTASYPAAYDSFTVELTDASVEGE